MFIINFILGCIVLALCIAIGFFFLNLLWLALVGIVVLIYGGCASLWKLLTGKE